MIQGGGGSLMLLSWCSGPPPRHGSGPSVDAALTQRGADSATRRSAAQTVVAAIWAHGTETRRKGYVEYVVWRLLEARPDAG